MSKTAKAKNKSTPEFQKQFYLPKFWGIWLGVGLLRLLAFTPYKWKFAVGRGLGKLLYILSPKRRRLATANIALCFPEKTLEEQQKILKQHFDSLGISLMEMGIVWWGDHKKTIKRHLNAQL